MRALLNMRWTIFFGVMLGVFSAPVGQTWWHYVLAIYDDAKPVVVMAGTLVQRDGPDGVVLHLAGEKKRSCRYLSMQAYTILRDGRLSDASAFRIDKPADGHSKPLGLFDLGLWRIWPVTHDAAAVEVYAHYDCDDRIVITRIATVALSRS